MSDLEAVPNPVIHSCQILDPGRDVRRIEIVSEELRRGRQMGYSRSRSSTPTNPTGCWRSPQGQGTSIGAPPEGSRRWRPTPRGGRLPRPAPAVAGVRRTPPRPTATGRWASSRSSSPPPTPRSTSAAVRHPRDRGHRRCRRHRWHRPAPGRLLARDVPGPRQSRSVPGRNRTDARRRRHGCRPHRHARRRRRRPHHHGGFVPIPGSRP